MNPATEIALPDLLRTHSSPVLTMALKPCLQLTFAPFLSTIKT